eukprot:TRINITY_DN48484_c0_g1_i1.p1 TRINITY_DN48484_c0_g1~~TRINITY_DN48484_c0_g1_i1.p1  ORF type:complete len:348 (+),score=71.34 TRINITY_DN48484_c0_g1_i1:73-1116(+)
MKASVVLLAIAVAIASGHQEVTPGTLQQLVEGVFEKYLPMDQKGDVCKRMVEQCQLFNDTWTGAKACHRACEHGDFQCHLKCPMAMPGTVKELAQLGEAMVCHKSCGKDRLCHKACKCPFSHKHKACGNLAEAVECHKRGGNHTTCRMEKDSVDFLLTEPWSLVQDVVNHVVDFLLPPTLPLATEQEVHSCHAGCGRDHACHHACPKGQWGALKEQCVTLDSQIACHKACKTQETACPFKKMSCHMRCPKSMPESIEEVKAMAEHMACHFDCGKDHQCHKSCPVAEQWTERKEKCAKYELVSACHKGCHGQGYDCHVQCPHTAFPDTPPTANSTNSMIKEVVTSLLV